MKVCGHFYLSFLHIEKSNYPFLRTINMSDISAHLSDNDAQANKPPNHISGTTITVDEEEKDQEREAIKTARVLIRRVVDHLRQGHMTTGATVTQVGFVDVITHPTSSLANLNYVTPRRNTAWVSGKHITDGLALLRAAMEADRDLPVILITGHGDVPMAVEAMRVGAFDFLEKPFNPDRMTELAKKASQQRRLTLDNRALRRELSDGSALMKKLIGASQPMTRLKEDILDLGQADGHVLIEGETGTGKTLVAHALHAVGSRAAKKFVLLSCSAYDEDTLGRRLFGPAAEDEPVAAVEEARGGTLVLEDVEALSPGMQSRLLTAINDQGSPAETRIVAICNLQDEGKTTESVLRPDLFYRLAALRITVPPLRQRGEDILTLFTRLSEQFAEEYGCDAPEVSAQEAAQLLQAPWPGNVRQLINVAERAVLQNRRGSGSIASLVH